MPRKKHVGPCVQCNERPAQNGRFCHKCHHQIQKDRGTRQAYWEANKERIRERARASRVKRESVQHRRTALERHGSKCADCGWDKAEMVLHVHHIDSDRKNGDISNLVILCPTCHFYRHYLEKSGVYAFYRSL